MVGGLGLLHIADQVGFGPNRPWVHEVVGLKIMILIGTSFRRSLRWSLDIKVHIIKYFLYVVKAISSISLEPNTHRLQFINTLPITKSYFS